MNFVNRSQAKKQTGLSYLGGINTSAKIVKNGKVGVYTYIIYLAPHKMSGYNVCTHSTSECRLGCLFNSGRRKVEAYSGRNVIEKARIAKTKLFFEHQNFFMDWMFAEIKAFKNKAFKDGFDFSVRLNGTSDIEWEYVTNKNGMTVFESFPDVEFYDYAKNVGRFDKELPKNYSLTYSFTGKNLLESKKLLAKGSNVAVVFDAKKFPNEYMGYPVINGDEYDARYLDPKGVVGLSYKTHFDKEINEKMINSRFVVNI